MNPMDKNDIIKRMTGGEKDIDFNEYDISAIFALQNDFKNRNGDPILIRKLQKIVIEKYLEIPEDERRYCLGDMDSKDYGIQALIIESKEWQ